MFTLLNTIGNPFTYRATEWHPPVSQLVVFQEAFPNKVFIYKLFRMDIWSYDYGIGYIPVSI